MPQAQAARGVFCFGEWPLRGEQIPIGILFSRSGSYSTIGEAMYAGALLAIEEVNASPEFDFVLAPRSIDPHGDIARYVEAARSMLDDGAVKHIIGCYTSSSRWRGGSEIGRAHV